MEHNYILHIFIIYCTEHRRMTRSAPDMIRVVEVDWCGRWGTWDALAFPSFVDPAIFVAGSAEQGPCESVSGTPGFRFNIPWLLWFCLVSCYVLILFYLLLVFFMYFSHCDYWFIFNHVLFFVLFLQLLLTDEVFDRNYSLNKSFNCKWLLSSKYTKLHIYNCAVHYASACGPLRKNKGSSGFSVHQSKNG